jgi:uncharacterized protein YndB with AHSA1/START domain
MPPTPHDRIEKQIVLKAPRSRVWKALTTVEEFNAWFGVHLIGTFIAGQPISGHITHPGYEHLIATLVVERIEPECLFSYRWHPYAIDTAIDYSVEPMTLVEFTLTESDTGTALRLVESGFDLIPQGRRMKAWEMNSGGWSAQMHHISRHVMQAAA